jgi:hypothetical protein
MGKAFKHLATHNTLQACRVLRVEAPFKAVLEPTALPFLHLAVLHLLLCLVLLQMVTAAHPLVQTATLLFLIQQQFLTQPAHQVLEMLLIVGRVEVVQIQLFLALAFP